MCVFSPLLCVLNRIGGVMVSVLALSALVQMGNSTAENPCPQLAQDNTCGHTELNMSNIDLIMSRAGNNQDNQK
jgi:hypothetical protein